MRNILLITIAVFSVGQLQAQNADSAEYYFQKGKIEKEALRYLTAAQFFDKAIKFNPTYKEALQEDGYVNLEMHKTDIAKAHFTKLYELEPSNKIAIKELTSLYFNYRQFQQAIDFAKKCTGCEDAERIIAMSSYHLEDYSTVVKGLANVIAKNPADAEATYTLGRSYLDMEQYKQAVPYYTKAVALDESKNVWAYELGLLYYNIDDYKNAVIFFNKAAQAGYQQGTDFNENLGYAYLYSGESEKGEKLLLGVLERKPGNKDILRDLAQAYYKQKMYDKSLEFCKKLMEIDSKDAQALYQAGLCFLKKGEKERGQGMCDKAIEMDPSLASKRQKNMSL